ncbi:hypothetical protein QFZ55_000107 [Streptomyces luteogriseus]|nr:hypothetical protein [Streptomyces luteogriseus]
MPPRTCKDPWLLAWLGPGPRMAWRQARLEQHGGRTIEGVGVRVAQRILARTCAIWHNRNTGAAVTRSLIAYDH